MGKGWSRLAFSISRHANGREASPWNGCFLCEGHTPPFQNKRRYRMKEDKRGLEGSKTRKVGIWAGSPEGTQPAEYGRGWRKSCLLRKHQRNQGVCSQSLGSPSVQALKSHLRR